jgi:hypothetical protein
VIFDYKVQTQIQNSVQSLEHIMGLSGYKGALTLRELLQVAFMKASTIK